MRVTDEVRVGMITALGILLLVTALIFIRGSAVGERGQTVEVVFGQIGGLKEGAEVQMAGVVVGNVEHVGLTEDHEALVRLRLHPDIVLPREVDFTVGTRGLLGEPFVRIVLDRPDSPLLREADLRDVPGLAATLRAGEAPALVHLRRMLSAGTRKLLAADLTPPERLATLRRELVRDLNRVLQTTALYEPTRFQDVDLNSEVRDLLRRNPRGEDLVRLNRLLLEAVLPTYVRRLPAGGEPETVAGAFRGKDPVALEDLVPQLGELMITVQGIAQDARALLADEELTDSLRGTVENVESLTQSIDQLVSDRRLSAHLAQSLENVEVATRQAALVTGDVRNVTKDLQSVNKILSNVEGITGDSREQIKELLKQTNAVMANFAETSDAIRWLVNDSGLIKEQVPGLVDSANKTVKNLEQITANLEKLTGDRQLQADLKESLTSLKDTLNNVRDAAASLRDLAADPGLQKDVRDTVSSARTAMANAASVTERVDNALEGTGEALTAIGRFTMDTQFDYQYLPSTNRTFADLYFDVWPSSKNFFRLGLHDFAEEDKLELQAGSLLSEDATLRFGLVRAKLGAGLDYQLGPRSVLSAELYDPNRLSLNLWGSYQVADKWSVTLGVEDLGDQSLGGVGVRFEP